MSEQDQSSTGPLSGLTVLEFAGLGPAPFAGMMFADMGANVILVERKPSAKVAGAKEQIEPRHFEICHRNKRSIALDLKHPDSISTILAMLKKVDIVLEGFRPGVMERLGLGPEACFAKNQALIYGRMTGWGQTGPMAQMAGHEPNYLAISGALHYARHGGTPWSPMTIGGDVGAGSTLLAWGCLAALFEAKSNGKGQIVDAAILDGAAYNSTLQLMLRNAGSIEQQAGQSWVDGGAPWSDNYSCKDGKYISLCALEPKFYAELCERLELTHSPVFAKQWDKSTWPYMRTVLESIFAAKTRDEWDKYFGQNDACFAPILTFEEAREHPQNLDRDTYVAAPGGYQPRVAPRLSQHNPSLSLPPLIGENTKDVLSEFGV